MNYGFEIEFFAGSTEKHTINNASHLIKKHQKIGLLNLQPYEIDPCPLLLTTNNFDIIADGTAFEIVGKRLACEGSMLGLNQESAALVINKSLDNIRNYIERLFNTTTILLLYVDEPNWKFLNPGNRYSSGKQKFNAYSGDNYYEDKKDDVLTQVTFRSAGFHIHIKFDEGIDDIMFHGMYAPEKCNELIQKLDEEVYKKYFPSSLDCASPDLHSELYELEKLRTEKYAKLGDYRIKFHNKPRLNNKLGYSTLEYRQFSSAFFLLNNTLQKEILHDFANTVKKFTNSLKNKK